ncbi:hypothetical protein V1L54_18400 [Streptomyces sp. TRM 70361]|uniref:4'-phosphopantetheinyl transferase family protein n=1 Tax=Streptomyces sp. TRM 70361 TaxID=3116553 RepID=UPI002E7B143D|nr:hypothetical protein [Streptomyces sp. TRM 70361]MEE1941354.1 hypothetical protein [Streptomyces sp. TRM 70361]
MAVSAPLPAPRPPVPPVPYRATAPRAPAAGIGESLVLDPSRPLYVSHVRGPLTVAVVSIAWLRERSEADRVALRARYLWDEEAARLATLHLPKRRSEWLAGRLAVKHSVCAYLRRHGGAATAPHEVRVRPVADGIRAGRPTVNAPVDVGLSHSGDLAVAVCGPRAVGIDLESDRPVPPLLAELLAVDRAGARNPGRRRLAAMPLPLRWACREAVLKHFGFGLRIGAQEVELRGWKDDGRFSWRAGPELRRHVPVADGRRFDSWAGRFGDYFLALVWQ